jgi:hypothetical protein
MHLRGIPIPTRLVAFERVVVNNLHTRILALVAASTTWEVFERQWISDYAIKDSTRMTQRDLNARVESTRKNMSTSAICNESERRFARLSALDQVLLTSAKVLVFLKAVDSQYRETLGALLEDVSGPNGLNADWAEVKKICSRFNMRRQWRGDTRVVDDAPQASLVQERTPAKSDQAPQREMREQSMLEELIRDMRGLKIANAQRLTKENQSGYNRRQSGL